LLLSNALKLTLIAIFSEVLIPKTNASKLAMNPQNPPPIAKINAETKRASSLINLIKRSWNSITDAKLAVVRLFQAAVNSARMI